jgi:hypothetical protein
MRWAGLFAVLTIAALTVYSLGADSDKQPSVQILTSEGSIQIGNIELRQEPGTMPYISLAAAEKALGKPEENYQIGNSVHVYAWEGLHLLKSLKRPAEMVFKLQVWFDDYYDKEAHKHTGKFGGHAQVDGVDIGPETTLDAIRVDLQKKGFALGDSAGVKYASKREVSIFTVGGKSDKIQRVEVWVTP